MSSPFVLAWRDGMTLTGRGRLALTFDGTHEVWKAGWDGETRAGKTRETRPRTRTNTPSRATYLLARVYFFFSSEKDQYTGIKESGE